MPSSTLPRSQFEACGNLLFQTGITGVTLDYEGRRNIINSNTNNTFPDEDANGETTDAATSAAAAPGVSTAGVDGAGAAAGDGASADIGEDVSPEEIVEDVVEDVRSDIQMGHIEEDVATVLDERLDEVGVEMRPETIDDLAEDIENDTSR